MARASTGPTPAGAHVEASFGVVEASLQVFRHWNRPLLADALSQSACQKFAGLLLAQRLSATR